MSNTSTASSTSTPPITSFPIVGVGASAGGLESLERMFRALPDRTGMAFVVVQHLSPDHKSLMDELLARYTGLAVVLAEDNMVVEPDHVYLMPAGKELEIVGGRLRVTDKVARAGLTFPIDRFLESLAEDAGSRAVAVVLSGSGSDGSRGIRRIHQRGGLVIVEDPSVARFDGMPRASVETGIVDIIIPAEAIARPLLDHANGAGSPDDLGGQLSCVDDVLQLLHHQFRIDFTEYKRATIYRRLTRRLTIRRIDDLAAYVTLLADDHEELRALCHDLLIGVTSFFRDTSCFDAIEREVIPQLFAEGEDREIRAWVAGCATGEEAYSFAMLLDEARRASTKPDRSIKLFATDIHGPALEIASAGVYSEEQLATVSGERRVRYFQRRDDGRYVVAPELRQIVVFAPHNLLRDAPFTNLDLVSCRNMLIYFRTQAQRRALAMLLYGLRVGGCMVLGSSENLGGPSSDYDTIDEHNKIYRKRQHARLPTDFRLQPVADRERVVPPTRSTGEPSLLPIYDALLDRFMPMAFLVGERRALVDTYGGADGLLRVRKRRPTTDLLDLVPDPVRVPMAGALSRAIRESTKVVFGGLDWPMPDGTNRRFEVTIDRVPLQHARGGDCHLVCLRDVDAAVHGAEPSQPALGLGELSGERMFALEEELVHAKANLQATVEELEASNEELQATNEELVASNEELQSLNEELHSVNEELHTVNAEYQQKIDELTELNQDIRHLLESIDVATVFLDNDLRIRKYTPRAVDVFSLVAHDIGRHLASFNHPLRYPDLMDDVVRVRDTGQRVEKEVRAGDRRRMLVRLLPYVVGGQVRGVVLTLTDASTLAAERDRAEQLSALVESSGDAIIGLHPDGTIASWNAGAAKQYEYSADEAIGSPIAIIVPECARAELRTLHRRAAAGEHVVNVRTVRSAKSGTMIDVSSTLSPIADADRHVTGVSMIDRDIRTEIEIERRLVASERKYEDLYNESPDMYVCVDARTGRVVECNDTFCRASGYARDEVARMNVADLFAADCQIAVRRWFDGVRGESVSGPAATMELVLRRSTGEPLDVELSSTNVVDDRGIVVQARTVIRDTSLRKLAERASAEANRLREQFLAIVSHELRNPLHAVRSAFELVESPSATDIQRGHAQVVIRRQTAHMARLVDDLLDLARITQNRLELRREATDVAAALRDAIDAAAAAYERKGVSLVVEGLDAVIPMFGDRGRLEQVFTNLLSNALRHTPRGREVVVRAARDGGIAEIKVQDQGDGIAGEQLERIFEMFVQAEQGLARQEGGLGLGLSLAQRIVNAHGGTIEASSPGLGRGATFTIRFDVDDAARSTETTARVRDGGRRIVVVEDQVDSREILAALLAIDGHDVECADDGLSGIALLDRVKPDIGIVDIGLPGIDGFEVARRLRAANGRAPYLIALTGYGQPADVERAREAGFDRLITKPVDMAALRRILETAE